MPTRSRRRREARSRRRRRLLWAALSLAVAAGGAAYLLTGHSLSRYLATHAGAAGAHTAQTAAILRTPSPCPPVATATPGTATPGAPTPDATTPGSPTPGSPSPGSPSPGTSNPATATPVPASPPATLPPLIACPGAQAPVDLTPPRLASVPGPPGPSSPAITAAIQQVLTLINQTRIQDGFAPLTLSRGLSSSAAAHTRLMATGCGLAHECPGEPPLAARETAAGVHWTAAGENIAEGGPEPANATAIARLATTLTQDMFNENGPGAGHRQNLLSPRFHRIGIAIIRDRDGSIWLTQDFAS